MENLDMKEIESAVEGILFASGDPVHIDRICIALEADRPTAERVLQNLMDHYAYDRRGVRLLHVEDTWQLCSAPEHADAIRRAFEIRNTQKQGGKNPSSLLKAACETLILRRRI